MDTKKTKKIQMPGALRSKLMAAIAMLLVASVMMVSAAYAWFTLSTAPEVTGITTSVGANGNLEIALFTTETFAAPASIQSAVGNSMQNGDVIAANITWGNLVDLSDTSYGLTDIKLNQSVPSIGATGALNIVSPLNTARYGYDGRVIAVDGETVSAVKTTDGFVYNSAAQTYGVRAVGQATNLSARQIAFNGAKANVTSNESNAKNATKNAIAGASGVFLGLALAGNTEVTSYSASQVSALKDIAVGMRSSLNSIVLVYANAGLATAASASGTATDEQVSILKDAITSDAAAMKAALNTAGVNIYDSVLTEIAASQTAVNGVVTGATALLATDASTFTGEDIITIKGYVDTLVGDDYTAYDKDNVEITTGQSDVMANGKKVYLEGTATSGGNTTKKALAVITGYTGNFEVTNVLQMTVYAGAADDVASWPNISALESPSGAAVSNITDTYGYILDFAFRTNAADSNLQLQEAAANRVYAGANDETLATMGSGSNVSFTYSEATSADQAETLLNNVKFIFFNPVSGEIYRTAKLANISAIPGSATADIVTVDAPTPEGEDPAPHDVAITELNQNEIKKVSVLVYLDGTTITNADVANAAESGTLDVNFQFSSSATLIPMENSALRNQTKD